MSRAARTAAGLMVTLGAVVSIGASGGTLSAAAPVEPTTTPAPPPAPTTAAPPQTPAPPTPTPAAPTTTIPYATEVERDCAKYEGDKQLADKLAELKGNDGSARLVVLAELCGVQFAEEAEVDADLDRPWSNLEYAVRDKDEPYFTKAYDAVTANPAQAELVQEKSTEKWYELHPELVPETTAAPATAAPATTAGPPTTVGTGTTDVPDTTEPDDSSDDGTTERKTDEQSQTGNPFWQIVGVLILGVGAAVWGISSVRREPAQ